jgi:hypothetical protein
MVMCRCRCTHGHVSVQMQPMGTCRCRCNPWSRVGADATHGHVSVQMQPMVTYQVTEDYFPSYPLHVYPFTPVHFFTSAPFHKSTVALLLPLMLRYATQSLPFVWHVFAAWPLLFSAGDPTHQPQPCRMPMYLLLFKYTSHIFVARHDTKRRRSNVSLWVADCQH